MVLQPRYCKTAVSYTHLDVYKRQIIDRALLRLKRYPDRGELYYEILTKQFIYRFNSTEKELLEELNIERSVFYDLSLIHI